MKNVLLSLCCVLASGLLFAAGPDFNVPASLESEATAEMFGNEIDDQFAAGSAFGSYDQHFIYGGLGNPGHLFTTGGSKVFDNDTPMTFGYYMPWKFPMSFYAGFGAGAPISPSHGGTETTWEDNTHAKVKKIETTSYYPTPVFKNSTFQFQYLVGIGTGMNMVTGVQFAYTGDKSNFDATKYMKLDSDDRVTPANSYTERRKGFSKTTIPTILLAFNPNSLVQNGFGTTVTNDIPELKDNFSLKIPVAFTTGKFDHLAALKIGSDITSKNGYYYAATKDGKSRSEVDISIVGATTDLRLEYGINIPAADRETDSWTAGAALGFDFTSTNEHTRYFVKDKDTGFEIKDGKYNRTYKPQVRFALDVNGGRMLCFASPKKAVLFNMNPNVALNLNTGMNGGVYDENINGSVTISGLSVANGKYAYSKRVEGDAKQYKYKTEFSATASLPMGLRLMPENWKVGLLLGADLSVTGKVTVEGDTASNHKGSKTTTKTTIAGVTNTQITDHTGNYSSNSYNNTPSAVTYDAKAEAKYSIGITVPFEGGAHLEAKFGGNLTEIDKIIIQAFIPLGTGKKTASNQ